MAYDFDRVRTLVDKVAVVGVGDTDYGADYREGGASRQRGAAGSKNAYTYAAEALNMALAESGLKRGDIDGLIVNGDINSEVTCELFGLQPTWQGTQPYPDVMISSRSWQSCPAPATRWR